MDETANKLSSRCRAATTRQKTLIIALLFALALPPAHAVEPSTDHDVVVSFTNLSSQLPTAWSWDFGDGGSSTDQHPTHQYNISGNYTVSLTVTNPNGSHTLVMPKLISVTGSNAVFSDGFEEPE